LNGAFTIHATSLLLIVSYVVVHSLLRSKAAVLHKQLIICRLELLG
jgi:hypothetical protein